jgi:hypothetical protein
MTYKKLPKLAGQLAGHSSPSAVDPRLEPFIEVMAELLVSEVERDNANRTLKPLRKRKAKRSKRLSVVERF